MKEIIKLFNFIVSFCLLIFLLTVNVCASESESILVSVDSVKCTIGERIAVPISIVENPGIVSLSLNVDYDDTALTLIAIEDTQLLPGATHSSKLSSPYSLTWVNDNAGSNINATGTIAKLIFEVSENAVENDYSVRLTNTRDNVIICGGDNITATLLHGRISVLPKHRIAGSIVDNNGTTNIYLYDLSDKEIANILIKNTSYNIFVHDGVYVLKAIDNDKLLEYIISVNGNDVTKDIDFSPGNDLYQITGQITSSDSDTTSTANDTITIELANTDNVYTITVTSSGINKTVDYSIENVLPGTYTMTVNKANHVDREYTVVVGSGDVTQDVKICLLGDVTGDGKVNISDVVKINGYVKKKVTLTDYESKCANVTGDTKVNISDVVRVNGYVKKKVTLW